MDLFFLFIVGLLFIFAVSDLIVGVSNDAVNFLNSAVGSRAASIRWLLAIASLGVLVGAIFSGGMMEIARKGLFRPEQFYFEEVMIIFLAVMISDVLLLDFFNTFGLPTSTTVSLVFELLGAAFVMSIIKIINNGETLMVLSKYINAEKALAIISAIFVSIAVAFIVGYIVMFLTRLIFTFQWHQKMLFWGSVFGGLSFTFISYFIFIKGLKDVFFITPQMLEFVQSNLAWLLIVTFISITLIFILLYALFKINVFKIVVLYGTFGLAMAFAGNDLVNFIGVPMAGYHSYLFYQASGTTDPSALSMHMLADKIKPEPYFLIAAGIIMMLALWFSKKARTVIQTSINLSKQKDGYEQFGANEVSRAIVRFFYNISEALKTRYTYPFRQFINKRFENATQTYEPDPPAFDLVRASINLMVASSLIAFATSLKLPLSTTYVTFMVAMATSLADRAWGRENAIYRVSGVFTVIGGWFLTAFAAFTLSGLICLLFWFGKIPAIILMVPIVFYVLYRTHLKHKQHQESLEEKDEITRQLSLSSETPEKISCKAIYDIIPQAIETIWEVYEGLKKEDVKALKHSNKKSKKIDKRSETYKDLINSAIETNEHYQDIKVSEYFIKIVEALRGIAVSISFIAKPSYQHVNNLHKSLNENQLKDFEIIYHKLAQLSQLVLEYIHPEKEYKPEPIVQTHQELLQLIDHARIKQIERLKKKETPSRSSMLFLNIVSEIRYISFFLIDIFNYENERLEKSKKTS